MKTLFQSKYLNIFVMAGVAFVITLGLIQRQTNNFQDVQWANEQTIAANGGRYGKSFIVDIKYNPKITLPRSMDESNGFKCFKDLKAVYNAKCVSDKHLREQNVFGELLSEKDLLQIKKTVDVRDVEKHKILDRLLQPSTMGKCKEIVDLWQEALQSPSSVSCEFHERTGDEKEFSIANELLALWGKNKRNTGNHQIILSEKIAPLLYGVVKNLAQKLSIPVPQIVLEGGRDCGASFNRDKYGVIHPGSNNMMIDIGIEVVKHATNDEIEWTFAHEFSHIKLRHPHMKLDLHAIATHISEKMAGDLSEKMKIHSLFFSRIMEREADTLALEITQKPVPLITDFLKYGNPCLHEPSVKKATHPYDHERICFAFSQLEDFAADCVAA